MTCSNRPNRPLCLRRALSFAAATGLVLCAALFAGAGSAHARNDFQNGFEDELGRIVARTTASYAVLHGPPPPPLFEPIRVVRRDHRDHHWHWRHAQAVGHVHHGHDRHRGHRHAPYRWRDYRIRTATFEPLEMHGVHCGHAH